MAAPVLLRSDFNAQVTCIMHLEAPSDTTNRSPTNLGPKSSLSNTEVVVRQYGLLQPLDWADDCDAELRRMVDFWNALVEIEGRSRREYRKLMQSDTALMKISAEISLLVCERASLIAKRNELRAAGQGKVHLTPINKGLADLGRKLSELRKAAALLSKEAREKLKVELRLIESRRRADVKIARQGSGLWWGNYNAVVHTYEQVRSRVLEQGSEIRSKIFDGSGKITNQIQLGMSVSELFSGAHSQVAVRPLPEDAWSHPSRGERRRLQRTVLTATVFTREGERRTVTWPMVMHRSIPQDCRIKKVVVTRRQYSEGWCWHVVFTCARTSEPKSLALASSRRRKAVHIGWRRLPDCIRVGTVASDLEHGVHFLTIPNVVVEAFAFADILRGKRQDLRDAAIYWLTKINWAEAPELLADKFRTMHQPSRDIIQLAELAAEWRQHREWRPDDYSRLEAWRREDKKLHLWEINHRNKLGRRRNDLYRQFARDIVEAASSITMNALDLPDLSRVDRLNGRQNPLPAAARRYRAIAAVSILRKFVNEAAHKAGISITYCDAAKDRVCYSCHCSVNYAASPFKLLHVCEACGVSFDKDWNSSLVMLTQPKQA